MRLLIVVPTASGRITQAQVHDVQNEATWATDGGLMLEDGRLHAYPVGTLLFDVDAPLTADVVQYACDGKYVISADELCLVDNWQPLALPDPPVGDYNAA